MDDEMEQEAPPVTAMLGIGGVYDSVTFDDLEFDVCEDGGIVSEHGSDAVAALNEAIRRRRATAPEYEADVVTILVTRRADL